MSDIYSRIICLVAIILLGYFLNHTHMFPNETVTVLSKIILRVTLPATIVCGYAGKSFDVSLLMVVGIGIAANTAYVIIMLLLSKRQQPEDTAFDIVNTPGYNIGIFTLPLLQTIFGSTAAVVASLFDTGSSIISLGGSYSIASAIKDKKTLSLTRICLSLVKSVPLMTCIIMLVLSLIEVSLPTIVLEFATVLSNANVFLGMFMIGVAFSVQIQKQRISRILRILVVRYVGAGVIALFCWIVLPLETIIKQILVMLLFSPTAASSVAWTAELNGDTETAGAIGSISLLCSITILFLLMYVFDM